MGALTRDLTKDGFRYGGTVAYAGLTAMALGYSVTVLTTCAPEEPVRELLPGATIHILDSLTTTTFRNRDTPSGRIQQLYAAARHIQPHMVQQTFYSADIIHIAPVADECPWKFLEVFPERRFVATLQGWFRTWDSSGMVSHQRVLPEQLAGFYAVVLSLEDLDGDLAYARSLAGVVPIFVVTEGHLGARLFWQGNERIFSAPKAQKKDSCGAGDIFAAAFFSALDQGNSPKAAVRFANQLAAFSVTRLGLASVPTASEMRKAKILLDEALPCTAKT
ncbi:MAG: bifunctional hydroxymethylpyrimidine kinase/phosphomethylpyrimidine kinase [Deltaproteobacteria bacterium]|nr:bifunctional hydroxymethylpyrimidine kinase/phosphomethylpyrimidine kinase [Deltaproteobacteria bacterium]